MFGYILPEKPEMKIKEYELFRAFYCGVCKSIGKRYGQLPRLTLNYDCTFLAILLHGLSEDSLKVKTERCIAHPVKKSPVIKELAIIDYASDINVALAYHNLRDNWKDEHSVPSGAAMLLLKRGYGKIRKRYPEKCSIIEQRLGELDALEKGGCDSMDRAAEPFAKLMEEVVDFPSSPQDKKTLEILHWVGYNLGKWIYILDAYDDIKKDIGEKSYNPLLLQFQYKSGDVEDFKKSIRERVEFNLTHTLSQIARSFELLKIRNNAGILENIIYMGMRRKTEQILGTGSCGKVEQSV